MSHRPLLLVFAATVFGLGCSSDDGDASATADDATTSASTTDPTTGPGTGTSVASTGADAGSSTVAADDGSSGEATGGLCIDEFPAIVTDIDETLTQSDAEFFMQLNDGNYDPLERAGGAAMVNAYADLGYRVLYLTARSETWVTEETDETAREATQRWLEEHGYPTDPASTELVLAPMIVVGDATRAYKGDALMSLQAEGWRFDYAYGNASTDIGGYEDAGIAKDVTFIIGDEAGTEGTVAIEGEDWLAHNDAHLPTVSAACGAE